jgi:rhamnosyltransferase
VKIAAVIILYNPPEDFITNLISYYNYIDKIFIFDNTGTGSGIQEQLLPLSKVEFIQNNSNEGIAKPLNTGAKKAISENFEWMLMMDQDSHFSEGSISSYLNCVNQYPGKENIAMFGTQYGRLTNSSSETCEPAEINELIISGTLVNLNLFQQVGNFDEALFLDFVDHDYCIRAKGMGFSLVQFSNIFLSHQLGTEVYRSSVKTLFLVKKKKSIHSPLRCYYMYRNYLYLEKKYEGSNISLLKNIRGTAIGNILSSVFYGRDTAKTIKYFITARNDHNKNKMGRIVKEI